MKKISRQRSKINSAGKSGNNKDVEGALHEDDSDNPSSEDFLCECKPGTLGNLYERLFWDALQKGPERLKILRVRLKYFRQEAANPNLIGIDGMKILKSTPEEIHYVDVLYEEEIRHLETRIREEEPSIAFLPKAGLEEVVYPDYIFQFGLIERELISMNFLTADNKWVKNKGAQKSLCEFLVVIIVLKYTMSRIKEINVRRFFERRYGLIENGLADQFKPSKRPLFSSAYKTFRFINRPAEK